ncbi:hypothetical protein D3C75_1127070 [compost metagenome]
MQNIRQSAAFIPGVIGLRSADGVLVEAVGMYGYKNIRIQPVGEIRPFVQFHKRIILPCQLHLKVGDVLQRFGDFEHQGQVEVLFLSTGDFGDCPGISVTVTGIQHHKESIPLHGDGKLGRVPAF